MITAVPDERVKTNAQRLMLAARQAGCPRDQIKRFLSYGYVPQPKQLQFHAAARAADQPGQPNYIALGGDRSAAKSHTIMAQVMQDDCQRYEGLEVLYIRKVGKSAKKALEQLRKKLFIHIPHSWNQVSGLITFHETGSSVQIGHFQTEDDIDQYIGIEFDVIVTEEQTQLSGQKLRLLRGSLRTSKPGWRARHYGATNPGGIGHEDFKSTFVDPYREGTETNTKFIPISWRDNAFVDPDYVDFLKTLTGTLGRMWRDGDWDVGAGMFFTNWDRKKHVIEPFYVPLDSPVWVSFDYGFSHPTAVYWHTVKDGQVYTIAEHCAARWLPEQHADAMQDVTENILHRPFPAGIDFFVAGVDVFSKRATGQSVADQYKEFDIHFRPAITDRLGGAAMMLKRLGNEEADIPPTWFIFNRCVKLIQTIPAMLADPNRPEDVLKVDADEEGEGGDDSYDSARYGLMSVPGSRGSSGFSVKAN